jgi:hypothetical protein
MIWDRWLYFPSEGSVCYGFLSPIKNPPPSPGSEPATMGPMASMLTTRPPRAASRKIPRLKDVYYENVHDLVNIINLKHNKAASFQ